MIIPTKLLLQTGVRRIISSFCVCKISLSRLKRTWNKIKILNWCKIPEKLAAIIPPWADYIANSVAIRFPPAKNTTYISCLPKIICSTMWIFRVKLACMNFLLLFYGREKTAMSTKQFEAHPPISYIGSNNMLACLHKRAHTGQDRKLWPILTAKHAIITSDNNIYYFYPSRP